MIVALAEHVAEFLQSPPGEPWERDFSVLRANIPRVESVGLEVGQMTCRVAYRRRRSEIFTRAKHARRYTTDVLFVARIRPGDETAENEQTDPLLSFVETVAERFEDVRYRAAVVDGVKTEVESTNCGDEESPAISRVDIEGRALFVAVLSVNHLVFS